MKPKQVIKMNPDQFKELKQFYISLGLTEKQAERLQKQAFQYTIKPDEKTEYSVSWDFYPRMEFPSRPFSGGRMAKLITASFHPGFMPMSESADEEDCYEEEDEEDDEDSIDACFAGVTETMVACASAPAMMAREATMNEIFRGLDEELSPQFNTAETINADELPKMNPLKETEVIFSANVNNASWSYIRNSVVRGRQIDPSFVRTEEMINSFDYGLTAPEDGKLFSVTSKANTCPWDAQKELLFVGIKGMEVSEHKPNHLVFLVDVSGSMEDHMVLEQMAVMALVSRLGKGDTMSIITYSNDTNTVVKNLDCGNMDKCIDAVLHMVFTNGGTFGSRGLEDAYKFLEKYPSENVNRRVFIFTDGDFNFGISSDGGLENFIKEKKKSGIYLSVVGYGMENFKDNHMETLARNGNGNYCFVGCPEDIAERLFMQFESTVYTIAKNVKIKVEMNPEYVSDYRLIGYHARSLTRQDFDNKEKSVDGIGSGHSVVGLIEFTPKQSEPVTESRYTQTQSKHLTEELGAVTIRYQSPDDEHLEMFSPIPADLDKNSHLVEIAGFLASFGLEMSDSDYKGTLDKSALQALIEKYQHDEELKEYCSVFRKYLEKI